MVSLSHQMHSPHCCHSTVMIIHPTFKLFCACIVLLNNSTILHFKKTKSHICMALLQSNVILEFFGSANRWKVLGVPLQSSMLKRLIGHLLHGGILHNVVTGSPWHSPPPKKKPSQFCWCQLHQGNSLWKCRGRGQRRCFLSFKHKMYLPCWTHGKIISTPCKEFFRFFLKCNLWGKGELFIVCTGMKDDVVWNQNVVWYDVVWKQQQNGEKPPCGIIQGLQNLRLPSILAEQCLNFKDFVRNLVDERSARKTNCS